MVIPLRPGNLAMACVTLALAAVPAHSASLNDEASSPVIVLGDGSCLKVADLPPAWTLAPANQKSGNYELLTRADLAAARPGQYRAAILSNRESPERVVTYLAAASPGRWSTDAMMQGVPATLRMPEGDIGDLRAYRIEHGGVGYLSDDLSVAMECHPVSDFTPAACSIASHALMPAYRLALELAPAERGEARALIAEAVALASKVLRPCGA